MAELELRNYKNRFSFKSRLGRVIWHITWTILGRTTPRGSLFRLWRVSLVKLFGAKVSWSVNILPRARIWAPWDLEMGDYSCLSNDVFCYNVGGVVIGKNVVVSEAAWICPGSHILSSPIMELKQGRTVLKDNCWIAARAFIGHVTIGEGAVVGACSVVTKDVAPWTVVGGNPAKVIKKRELK